jgi:hypothetical protein
MRSSDLVLDLAVLAKEEHRVPPVIDAKDGLVIDSYSMRPLEDSVTPRCE